LLSFKGDGGMRGRMGVITVQIWELKARADSSKKRTTYLQETYASMKIKFWGRGRKKKGGGTVDVTERAITLTASTGKKKRQF